MDERLIRGPDRESRTFRLGDRVRILSGAFTAFHGHIEGINQAAARLKIKVEIYGRDQPVKLNFSDVEKISFS